MGGYMHKKFAMGKSSAGFTLIELVVVMVILAILAVVAIPKYIDLTSDANTAATNGVAGALSSASAINYAARKANAAKGVAVANCTDVSGALQGTLPTGYTITAATVAANVSVTCTLTGPGAVTATFVAIGVP
jgi:prepilin-type N-terminal cleavage/methylation domain-containing protein